MNLHEYYQLHMSNSLIEWQYGEKHKATEVYSRYQNVIREMITLQV